jgi:uncharacterized protein (TIGR02996 family)
MPTQFPVLEHPPSFWQDIHSAPWSDEPRLRYAAWLEEEAEPLGEFIQVQCRLAAAPESEIAWEWERREQELLADHEEEWAGELRGLVDWFTFRRGFIEEISVSAGRFLQHAQRLFEAAPIQVAHLSRSREYMPALANCPWLARLRHLDLSNNFVRDHGAELLAESPQLAQLHSLNLSSAALGDAGARALAMSPNLMGLRELYLCDNRIGPAGARALAYAPLADRLELLHLRFNELDGASAAILKQAFGNRVHW